jgi:hypothetical protein
MSFGHRVEYLAVGGDRHLEVLADPAADFRRSLDAVVNNAYRAGGELRESALLHSSVLTRFDSFLLQAERMTEHLDALVTGQAVRELWAAAVKEGAPVERIMRGRSLGFAALTQPDAGADFESLLFHARSALDLLTCAIAKHHKQQMHRYSKLTQFVERLASKSVEARAMRAILRDSPNLSGVITDLEKKTSLRSLITHYSTVSAATSAVFCVHLLDGDRQLILDSESHGYGVFDTTWLLMEAIPFVALNGVAIYLGAPRRLEREQCQPRRTNPTTRVSDWFDESKTGPRLHYVRRMNPDGFEYSEEHVRPGIMDRAITIAPV